MEPYVASVCYLQACLAHMYFLCAHARALNILARQQCGHSMTTGH